ncbi:hypothetical protein BDB01DRAFT_214772 [Pilobolus umbonatus]|nr:hypothetical protein BDB01DRAFT_214772 [Pilobolus umbonatus]
MTLQRIMPSSLHSQPPVNTLDESTDTGINQPPNPSIPNSSHLDGQNHNKKHEEIKESVDNEWTVVPSTKRNKAMTQPQTKTTVLTAAKKEEHLKRRDRKSQERVQKKHTQGVHYNNHQSNTINSSNDISQDNKHQPSITINGSDTNTADNMELPCLSDNDSSTESIDMPVFNHTLAPSTSSSTESSLSTPSPAKVINYYSPFSTGFDLEILPRYHDSDLEKRHRNLSSQLTQRPTSYTPHKISMLNLLNQPDSVKTSITSKTFSYFDDTMLSHSLYHDEEAPLPTSEFGSIFP